MTLSAPDPTIPHLLCRNAEIYGDKVAFESPTRVVSHREFESRTQRIACQLGKVGIDHGHYVVVLLGRCVEAVESIFAIIRAGAIAVPLDPRCSRAELATILDDIGAECQRIITDSAGARNLQSIARSQSMTIWTIDSAPVTLNTLPFEDLTLSDNDAESPDSLAASDRAFLHYTSGTTGSKSKGVFSSQQAWIQSTLRSNSTDLKVSSDDRILCPIPVTHAYGFSCGAITALCTGAAMYLTGDQSLAQIFAKRSFTIMLGVPTTYSELVSSDIDRASLSSLRMCMSGAAPASAAINAQVGEIIHTPLLSNYGSTESCGIITSCRLGEPFVEGTCGSLMPHRELRIVDPATAVDVAHGDEGEIWIRGISLFSEYHNIDTSPFTEDGWFRTGDIGCWDGKNLIITGRLKEIILRGGQNIHPAEVERVLDDCAGVKECVVTAARHDAFGEVPVAYMVPDHEPLDIGALISACRESLPNYKIPVDFFEIDAVPRTRVGKPRRLAVNNIPKRRVTAKDLTLNAIEATILAEFSHARGIPPGTLLEPTAEFSDMGMNSLVGIVIRDRLMALTGLDLPITLLFDHTTPRSLSEHTFAQLTGNNSSQFDLSSPTEQPLPDADDPIAIISMACRYPGGIASPEDLWRVVEAGVDVTSDFPTNRGWDMDALHSQALDSVGTAIPRRGGFLHDMADFDADLFTMSPKEAEATDPQQRLLLESTWNLLERAGVPPTSLRGSNTGIYCGLMYNDHGGRYINHQDHNYGPQLDLGSAASVAVGRVSYAFDFHGPSLAIDTACSSSLVAVDLAAKALKAGDCSLAIAGGVTVMATPTPFIMFSKQGGLSPDGLCRSYSDDANGTVWSEGVSLLLLERLSDARKNGHQILGLVRGTAVNSDGKSTTLTAPSGAQQEHLIRHTLRNARLSSNDIDVVEGHGTSTPLGDPIEIHSLIATYGQNRSQPLLLGSVKSNLGHTQAAAGVAGIIKMVMAMREGIVPASLHVTKPSRHVDWLKGNVKLLMKAESWPEGGKPRRAAVSAFGIGGTNAHVILEQGETLRLADDGPRSKVVQLGPWVLSGASESALQAQALTAEKLLILDSSDVAFSLATTRSHLRWRAAVLSQDREALRALAEESLHPKLLIGQPKAPRLVIMFSGQGGQIPGMFEELSAGIPVFKTALEAICDALDTHLTEPLLSTLRSSPEAVYRMDIAQPAIFAFQVALYRMLEHFGVQPAYLIGHSIGEIAAAHVSGVLSLEDAAKIIAARGRLMSAVPDGAMISIEASEIEVQKELDRLNQRDEQSVIAAANSEESTVIAGSEAAVVAVAGGFRKAGRRTKRLRTSHACHSPAMEGMLPAFTKVLDMVSYGAPRIPIISTVTGKAAGDLDFGTSEYWARQLIQPVRFADAVESARELGGSAFLEIGSSAALSMHVKDATPTGATIRSLLDALAHLHVQGSDVAWSKVFEGGGAHKVELPTYPFQRRRYWIDPPKHLPTSGNMEHPFLEQVIPIAGSKKTVFRGALSLKKHPWLGEHVMSGRTILPATAFAEMAVRVGNDVGLIVLQELTLLTPLELLLDEEVSLQIVFEEAEPGSGRTVDVYSGAFGSKPSHEWNHHASGILNEGTGDSDRIENIEWPIDGEVNITGAYDKLSDSGIVYGPSFRCVNCLWRTPQGFIARLRLPETLDRTGHLIHPALLDAALHLSLLVSPADVKARLPFHLASVRLWQSKEREVRVVIDTFKDDEFSVQVYDLRGQKVAEIERVTLRAVASKTGDLLTLEWSPFVPAPTVTVAGQKTQIVRIRAQSSEEDQVQTVHDAVKDIHKTLKDRLSSRNAQGGQEKLVIVTERATGPDPDLTSAAVWGLVRSAQSEHGDDVVLIEVDALSESKAVLNSAIASGKTLLAVRKGKLLAPKLVRDTAVTKEQGSIDTSGTILITGGTGALGMLLARHLVQQYGAKHLLLVSRSGPSSSRAKSLQDELVSYGANVTVESCDVANYHHLQKLLQDLKLPVTAVFHSAGVIDDGLLESLTPDRISKVLRPKVDAAYNLHRLLPQANPFVLFSSAAGVLGNTGQANYAAANVFLDALAQKRAHQGLHGLSLAWGPWQSEAGMAGKMAGHGPLLPLSDQQGLDLLDAALVSKQSIVVPLLLRGQIPEIAKPAPRQSTVSTSKTQSWRKRLGQLPVADRMGELQGLIRREVAAVLGHEKLPDLPFSDLGLDSLTGIKIRNNVSSLAGVQLSSSVIFECENVSALAEIVLEKVGDLAEEESQVASADPQEQNIAKKKHGESGSLGLATLCERLCHAGSFNDTLNMLAIAGMTLPVLDEHSQAISLRRLRPSKSSELALVCLPDFFPSLANLSVFKRILPYLQGDFEIFDINYPIGTVAQDLNQLVEIIARTIITSLPNRQIILLGYSAGGLVAHTLARNLSSHLLAGLILLDTYRMPKNIPNWLASLMGKRIAEAGTDLYDDEALATMGHSTHIVQDFTSGAVPAPTLFVRAEKPTPEMEGEDWEASWPDADRFAVLPGDHISLLREHASTTGEEICRWVGSLSQN